ncbi:hypothetical protein C8F01DRAFT_1348131 [Mycena amicta]|nr:hypothetical protein C8F01DRAFT_1348131 [Mycena amicta]
MTTPDAEDAPMPSASSLPGNTPMNNLDAQLGRSVPVPLFEGDQPGPNSVPTQQDAAFIAGKFQTMQSMLDLQHEQGKIFLSELQKEREERETNKRIQQIEQSLLESQQAAANAEQQARDASAERDRLRILLQEQRARLAAAQNNMTGFAYRYLPDAPPHPVPTAMGVDPTQPGFMSDAARRRRHTEQLINSAPRASTIPVGLPMGTPNSSPPTNAATSTSPGALSQGDLEALVAMLAQQGLTARVGAARTQKLPAHRVFVKMAQENMSDQGDRAWKIQMLARLRWKDNMGPFTSGLPQTLEDFAIHHPASYTLTEPQGEPPEGEYKWYLGHRFAKSNWNLVLLQKAAVQLQAERRANAKLTACLPVVGNRYLEGLFMNFLKTAVTGLNRPIPRIGESEAQAQSRAVSATEKNKAQAKMRSRRTTKLQKCKDIVLALKSQNANAGNAEGISRSQFLKQLLEGLGTAGMSDEEDAPQEHNGAEQLVHIILGAPWHNPEAGKHLRWIDSQAPVLKKGVARPRLMASANSERAPPKGLPRSLYNEAWLAQQSQHSSIFEAQLNISNKPFQMHEFIAHDWSKHIEDLVKQQEQQTIADVARAALDDDDRAALDDDDSQPTTIIIDDDDPSIVDAETECLRAFVEAHPGKQPARAMQDGQLLQKIASEIEGRFRTLSASNIPVGTSAAEKTAEQASLRAAVVQGQAVLDYGITSLARIPRDSALKHAVGRKLDDVEKFVNAMSARLSPETGPKIYNSGKFSLSHPIEALPLPSQVAILLGVVCNTFLQVAIQPTNFILRTVRLLVGLVLSWMIPNGAPGYDARFRVMLDQLPTSLHMAMKQLELDAKMTLYAACPKCDEIYAPTTSLSGTKTWPAVCSNMVVGAHGRYKCNTDLLSDSKTSPKKPFLSPSFEDYLARLVSDPNKEAMMQQASADAKSPPPRAPGAPKDHIHHVFGGSFFKNFMGPKSDKLFVDSGDTSNLRLAFSISLDFFPPHGATPRSSSASIGVLTAHCLNLPQHLRFLPENVYLSIIPGSITDLNPYLRPIVDFGVQSWTRGTHFTSTGLFPIGGRITECAFVLAFCDSPARVKLAVVAAASSHHFCPHCSLKMLDNLYDTNFENWTEKDPDKLRRAAEKWRDASTTGKQKTLFEESGVRWSEMWRLPYWNPVIMLAIDVMHCILEGLIHYHCRFVLGFVATDASKPPELPKAYDYAFSEPWTEGVDWTATQTPREDADIYKIHDLLLQPLTLHPDDDDKHILNPVSLQTKLADKRKQSLIFVCDSLLLAQDENRPTDSYLLHGAFSSLLLLLVAWRLQQPLAAETVDETVDDDDDNDEQSQPLRRNIDRGDIQFVQTVIAETSTPSWVNHVPKNYGEAGAGSMKADEWCLLGTIFMPIALVILWGEQTGAHKAHFSKLLVHSMHLFQATTIVCRYATSEKRATAYREHIRQWLSGLYDCHPHTQGDKKRQNPHAAFHVYDFLLAFGPALNWWCFPTERIIGKLQKINTNGRSDGEHEKIIVTTWTRMANLRRWLLRQDCPPILREFYSIMCRYLNIAQEDSDRTADYTDGEERLHAHYDINGMHFSRARTHLGNSMIEYATLEGVVRVGSIEDIRQGPGGTQFVVRQQLPLEAGKNDPFLPFPDFPAVTFSSHMGFLETISPSHVIGHVARFNFSDERAVILSLSRV